MSTTLTPRESRKLLKRQRILEAALSVFSTHGFSGASMDAIATAAAVSKPTLYEYFGDKASLFTAVLDDAREELLSPLDGSADKHMVDVLVDFAWHYAGFVLRPDMLGLARLIIGEVERFPGLGQRYLEAGPSRALAGIEAYVVHLEQAGQLAFSDSELTAGDLWSLILSTPRDRALHQPQLKFSADDLERHIFNGLTVFLKAYSTSVEEDLTRLETLRAQASSSQRRRR
jgi:TetR/AcrR family transcriptional regulator, mexJK operon transcriptional repressor